MVRKQATQVHFCAQHLLIRRNYNYYSKPILRLMASIIALTAPLALTKCRRPYVDTVSFRAYIKNK